MRVLRKASKRSEDRSDIKEKLSELESSWGVEASKLPQHLREIGPRQASEFVKSHSNLVEQLASINALLGSEYYPLISKHKDELKVREQNYGEHKKPEDYIDSFVSFIRDQINQSAALSCLLYTSDAADE